MQWGMSSFFGWGVYGLNLALAWASDPEVEALTTRPLNLANVHLDPLRMAALRPFVLRSEHFHQILAGQAGKSVSGDFPLLAATTDRFTMRHAAHDVAFTGQPTIAVTFFEHARLAPDVVERAKLYPLIVTGSAWNEQVLRAHGLEGVRTVLQGIDPTLFHPAPRAGVLGDRFLVFSGGKVEPRKGQDIVLAAFKAFAERRPDALLAAAWHSPWPEHARAIDASGLAPPVVMNAAGQVDARAWAQAAGVPAEQVLDLGAVPNAQLPPLLREMDVALFPNRAEGGTNLVAMEAMACGVPTILSANTGHLDLIEDGNCYALTDQRPIEGHGQGIGPVAGWGESSVDEAVALLETAYAERADARRRGLKGAETLARLTWARTAREMKQVAFST